MLQSFAVDTTAGTGHVLHGQRGGHHIIGDGLLEAAEIEHDVVYGTFLGSIQTFHDEFGERDFLRRTVAVLDGHEYLGKIGIDAYLPFVVEDYGFDVGTAVTAVRSFRALVPFHHARQDRRRKS